MKETVREQKSNCEYDKEPLSKVRKIYIARLVLRCMILVACMALYFTAEKPFEILQGMNFFHSFSVLHLLWGVWVIDMLLQLIPARKFVPLGSQKHFLSRFLPVAEAINLEALKEYVVSTTKSAYKVFILWVSLIAVIGFLYFKGFHDYSVLFLITVVFYVCDLICVLIWCPFRLIMKTRCCTTCRIFNWDHLMMFSPMLFIKSFYSWSLLLMAIAVWIVWELCVMLYPERFWENSNESLKCSNCTDKLCTQYCRKLRE